MPHIAQAEKTPAREVYREGDEDLTAKQLAFIIADVVDDFLGEDYDYEKLALTDGVLGTTHSEFRRVVLRPFEKAAERRNGTAFMLSKP